MMMILLFCKDKRICNGQTCRDENMVCKIKLGKELCTCKSGFRYNPRAESCDGGHVFLFCKFFI